MAGITTYPEALSWNDALALIAFDQSNPLARDQFIDLATLRTANAVFEQKRLRQLTDFPTAAGSTQGTATPMLGYISRASGADGVKGGEPFEEQDRNLHAMNVPLGA